MPNNKTREKFESSLKFLWLIGMMWLVVFMLGYLEQGDTRALRLGVTFGVLHVLYFFAMSKVFTYCEVNNGVAFRIKDGISSVKSAPIQNIISIERLRQFYGSFLKKEGSRMRVTYLTESSEEKSFHLREKQYSVETIKSLLVRLKEIKPSLKISQQYEDLLAGKYDDKNFHKVPAEEYGIEKLDK